MDGVEVHPQQLPLNGVHKLQEWAKADPRVTLGEYTKRHRYFQFVATEEMSWQCVGIWYPRFAVPPRVIMNDMTHHSARITQREPVLNRHEAAPF